ncbi:MAG: flagellar hook assembly protein FlgD [Ahrensia sp.]|nr:flagellar hook assembly protein FlgD [Ahrensia sp.]
MTTVQGVSAATSLSTANSTAASSASVDYDTFLQLLVTQMQQQDPTNPMDSTEYVAQLATFSNVEQAIITNDKLDSVLNASMLATASNLVGRTITGAGGQTGEVSQIRVTGGTPIAILDSGAEVALNGDWSING